MSLSEEHKKKLIDLARHEILSHLFPHITSASPAKEFPQALRGKCGAFVSLYVDAKLRGCIGTFVEDTPLYLNVKKMALSAAMNDSRFSPILAEETEKLKIEINVLSPRKSIKGPDEIEIGIHGIYIQSGTNRGTLLPSVAVNQQWNAEEFLGYCSRDKAGLDWDGWRSAELFTYEATVFDSDQFDVNLKKY